MNNFENWTEITRGLYRYVIAAKACYEIYIVKYIHGTDILNASANLYMVGTWRNKDGSTRFERELLCAECSVNECIEKAVIDDKENNKR